MHILIINPNTTASMTSAIAREARLVAQPDTQITAMNPVQGPASIQGREDGNAALPGLFALFDQEIVQRGGYDALIIACFDDTGLMDIRARSAVPVTGIGESAYFRATQVGRRFSVVTTLDVSVPVLEENIQAFGFASFCAKVRASGVPVLQLEGHGEAIIKRIGAEVERALAEDGCDVIVLGCAGMAGLPAAMQNKFKMPVIDGVAAAVANCESHFLSGTPVFMKVPS